MTTSERKESMTDQPYTTADPALQPFLEAIESAEQWVGTATGSPVHIGMESLAIATVYARIAQAHATNRAATYIGDLTALIAELCLRLDLGTGGYVEQAEGWSGG
jgi:hypothetical protein